MFTRLLESRFDGNGAWFQKRVLLECLLVITAFYLGGFTGILSSNDWRPVVEKCAFGREDILENVTYSELKASLLKTYGASTDEGWSTWQRIKDAMEAMEKVEFDGNPVPITNFSFLFMGGAGAAYNLEGLLRADITHIINLSPGTKCKFPGHFKYMHVTAVSDKPGNSLTSYFNSTTRFIEDARLNGGNVLVHCWDGESRSGAIVIAYLIKYHDMKIDEALALIRKTRPRAKPKLWFMQDLVDYKIHLVAHKHET